MTPTPDARARLGVFFNVRHYGATGDGKTVDTPAINRAIDAAAAAGGGMVLFPAGIYLCFSIRLKSNVHLHLEQGATILAADSPKPGETTGYNGGSLRRRRAQRPPGTPIRTTATTTGTTRSSGAKTFTTSPSPAPASSTAKDSASAPAPRRSAATTSARLRLPSPQAALAPSASAAPAQPVRHFDPRGDYPMYQAEQPGVGNKAIALKNCRNVQLRDFSILKGGHFGLLLTGVDNLTIDNLTIDTDRDGMDIDCCQNVRVSNCTVNSPWDDGICPKSSYALGYARATRNVTIANCFVTGCYQLGTVLDGTWKKFPAGSRALRHRPHQVRHRVQRRLHQHHHHRLRLRRLPGLRARNRRRRAARRHHHLQHHHARSRLRAALHAPRRAPPRPQRHHQGRHAQAHPRQQSQLPQRAHAHQLHPQRNSRQTPSKTSSSPTFMSKLSAAQRPMPPSSSRPKRKTPIPSPACSARCRLRDSSCATFAISKCATSKSPTRRPTRVPRFIFQDVDRADFFADHRAAQLPNGAFALHDVKDLRIGWSRAAADIVLTVRRQQDALTSADSG